MSTAFDPLDLSLFFSKSLVDSNTLSNVEWRYIKDILNTKVSMFYYDNLPEPLTSQILETALLFRNYLCFYKVEGMDSKPQLYIYIPQGTRDIYFKPSTVSIRAINGKPVKVDVPYSDIILARDNSLDIPPFIVINNYIEKIMSIENSLFQQLDILSLPLVLVTSEKNKAQAMEIAKKAKLRNPFIIGDKTLRDTATQGFDINIRISPLDIYDIKQKYRNECMQSLGIYSVEEKRERLIQQEVTNQNDYTDTIYQGAKRERELFISQINSKYGTNIVLKELYEINKREDIADTALEAGAVAKAEAQAQPKEPTNDKNLSSK